VAERHATTKHQTTAKRHTTGKQHTTSGALAALLAKATTPRQAPFTK
jgi:hypothetical protein